MTQKRSKRYAKPSALAIEAANKEFYNKHPELKKRALSPKAEDAALRREWMTIYRAKLQQITSRQKTLSLAMKEGEVQKIIIPKPKFVDGYWMSPQDKKIQKLYFGETVKIFVKSENLPPNTTATIELMENDPLIFDDDKISTIQNVTITGEEINEEFEFKEEWYDAELDNQNEVYFKVSAQINGKTIEEKFPKKTKDYLYVKKSNYRFPLSKRPEKIANKESYQFGARAFGSGRNKVNGIPTRYHAGCDIYAPVGEKVLAVDDGVIKRYVNFYWQTYALEIVHKNFIIRYGEVQPPKGAYSSLAPPDAISKGLPGNLKVGDKVKRGQHIAYIGQLRRLVKVNEVYSRVNYQNSMLHFEMFKDTSKSPEINLLSPSDGNSLNQYSSVTPKTYKRRKDLLDPTKILHRMVTD